MLKGVINEKFNNLIELKNDTDIKDEVKQLKKQVNTLTNDFIMLQQLDEDEDEDEELENKMELIKLENNKIINRIKKHEKLIDLLDKKIYLLKDGIKEQSHAIGNLFAPF